MKWAGSPDSVPVKKNKARFDEAREIGEVEEVEPGKSKRFTVTVKAGKYLLLCNQPGHFKAGQRTRFTVTG